MKITHRVTDSDWEVFVGENSYGLSYEYNKNYFFGDIHSKAIIYSAIVKTIKDDYYKLEVYSMTLEKPKNIIMTADYYTLYDAMYRGFEEIKKIIEDHKQRFSSSEKS